jgi:Tol biopolymer transport system component
VAFACLFLIAGLLLCFSSPRRAGASGATELHARRAAQPSKHIASSSTHAAAPVVQSLIPGQGKAVFTSERDGNAEIYVMNADGTGQVNLTKHPAKDATPVWSPDHTRIAFTSDRSGRSNIYVMDADGGNVRAVTNIDNANADYRVYDPAWSPDGKKLIYVGSFMGETSGLVVVNVDGSESHPILEGSTEVADPAWSPDGTRIAYVARAPSVNLREGTRFHLFVMNADGSGKTRLYTSDSSEPLSFNSFAYPPDASGPAWSPDGTRIAYVSKTSGNAEIYVTSVQGSYSRITEHAATDTLPSWVSDDILSFTSDRDGRREIYTVPVAIGGTVTRITKNGGPNFDADWQNAPPPPALLPNQRIAFVRGISEGNSEIMFVNSGSFDEHNLTNSPQRELAPAWSPDGTKIAYIRWPERALFVMNADGSGVRRLANVSDVAIKPAWSPDGARIAFIGGSDLAYNISVVNLDGTGQQLLIPNSATFFEVAWSPDGKQLAYVQNRFAGFNHPFIGVVNIDGSGERTLSTGDNLDRNPAWSPDSKQIAFTSTRDGNAEIYIMNADGTNQTRLTNDPATDEMPAWSPDGRTLAFSSDYKRPGFPIIVLVNPAMPGQRVPVTLPVAVDRSPDWQPSGRATFQFSSIAYHFSESGEGRQEVAVTRLGDLSQPASVEYFGQMISCGIDRDGSEIQCSFGAREGNDYVNPSGKLNFAPGEASKTINIEIIDDGKDENYYEFFLLSLQNAAGASLTFQGKAATVNIYDDDEPGAKNPIDDPRFFVRMHYLDFLGREPEQKGWDDWVDVLNGCPNVFNDPLCDRVHVSSAFFRSREFLSKGYFIYRFYRVALKSRPRYKLFRNDLPLIGGQTAEEIEERKNAYSRDFLARFPFPTDYSALSNEQYVQFLLADTGVTLTGEVTRETLLADLEAGRRTRAEVLRAIVEHPNVEQAYFNEAFVTMQYFGYLRRDPEETGYQNWLRVINRGDGYRVMVHGFVNSNEYRARFGTP